MVSIDGTNATTGDWIITRKNDRRLRTLRNGWVRNGDRWTVKDVRPDGSLVVRRQDRQSGAVVLPAAYVADHVDLGYAVTAHRARHHRRHIARRCVRVDDEGKPVRRDDPRPRPQPRLRHHG